MMLFQKLVILLIIKTILVCDVAGNKEKKSCLKGRRCSPVKLLDYDNDDLYFELSPPNALDMLKGSRSVWTSTEAMYQVEIFSTGNSFAFNVDRFHVYTEGVSEIKVTLFRTNGESSSKVIDTADESCKPSDWLFYIRSILLKFTKADQASEMIVKRLYLKGCDFEFYPYGNDSGDSIMDKDDDNYEGPMNLKTSIPFFNNVYNESVFINSNGVLHLENADDGYDPDPFPNNESIPTIAGYWSDFDNEEGGDIYFRLSTDKQVINRFNNEIIATTGGIPGFNGVKECVIATWFMVAPYNINITEYNTFQIIFGTDGTHTFAEYIYNEMMWANSPDEDIEDREYARIGFDGSDGIHAYEVNYSGTVTVNDHYSYSVLMFKIDGEDIIKLL